MTQAGYGSIASSVGQAISTWGSYQAGKAAISQKVEQGMDTIKAGEESATTALNRNLQNYQVRMNTSYEQEAMINEELGTVMSRRGLEAMKTASRLKTAGAGSGFSGNSVDEIINQSKYDEILDQQIVISRARKDKEALARQRVTDWMNFQYGNEDALGLAAGKFYGSTKISSMAGIGEGLSQLLGASSSYQSANGGTSLFSELSNTFSSGGPTYSDGSSMSGITMVDE